MRSSGNWFAAILSIAALAGLAVSAPAVAAGEQFIDVNGSPRWLVAHRPPDLKAAAPLVLLLHGGTGNMNQVMQSAFGRDWTALADRHGFLLVAPNGTRAGTGDPRGRRQHWNDYRNPSGQQAADVDDVQFMLVVIDWAARTHGIDRKRVYVTGVSNGGMMVYRLLIDAPQAVAGGAAFIANLPVATPAVDNNSAPVPILIANGTNDPLMKWGGGTVGARGQQDEVLSAIATRDFWIERNRAARTVTASRMLPDLAPEDGCRLKVDDYAARENGAAVRFVMMEGGGHTAPTRSSERRGRLIARLTGTQCRDADGAALAWEFFR